MADRKPLSKRTRFEIFKRDGFRCHYCGASALASPLHVDHIMAVADGGTDDPGNLTTACASCNLGKSAVPLEERKYAVGALTEAQREHGEQVRAYLEAQRDAAGAMDEVIDYLCEQWLRICRTEPRDLRSRMRKVAQEFDVTRLTEAFDIVAMKGLSSSRDQLQYMYGILRKWRAEARAPIEPANPSSREPYPHVFRLIESMAASVSAELRAAPERFANVDEKKAYFVEQLYEAMHAPQREIEIAKHLASTSELVEVLGVRVWFEPTEREHGRRILFQLIEGFDPHRQAYWLLQESLVNLGAHRDRTPHTLADAWRYAERLQRWLELWTNEPEES